ncbi:3-hydroxyacyl-CoA dehydrogenase/enoyl-CoA hydratase family protein [Lederbergia sp. NSJ-179]|uniref:3-hydroxyacyl-CoA dehydrogenase/enoyl-CoA hydratase family protein n=1 Tax=Lederbergia sp. NSJ-179 TaxID=2931402 RepID=UPI001FCFEA6C|nr:3-hydroxyacyl-CoA dehydrogenase/enoyl-CoA hydratase family protein [Lederbergia sp. NSJ-179]MCJ7840299.1 3-hydroxyacyl-CoA dehydrogenase/enoyl-CoA hydratase family protein [Lederbergia sp. NSJ-179]
MTYRIKKAAVIGSGVMGAGIAAHLANVGISTFLLDIVPNENKGDRNNLANTALKRLIKEKPAPLTHKKRLSYITPGNIEDDVEKLATVDWIIEVVVENLEVKKQVFSLIDQHRKSGSIVSSNTSGISIEAMAEGRSEDFRRHFLGTHFFNPPRYLKLLEIIPTVKTDPSVVTFMKQFGEDVLGKGVVEAKDTPNFIANRIGTYGLLVTVREMLAEGMSVGEVDSITGTLLGRPKSATFRTLDIVGLDTFIHVAQNVYEKVEGAEKQIFTVPDFMKKMLEQNLLGSKAGKGFYWKKGNGILELNPETFQYEPRKKLKTPGIEMAKQAKGTSNRLSALLYSDDRAGRFLWKIIAPVLAISAELVGEIADDLVAIDQAMKWGFGWKTGPFEIWDAIGVETSVQKMEAEGIHVPEWVKAMLENGHSSFYHDKQFYTNKGEYLPIKRNPKEIDLRLLEKQGKIVKKNSGANLIDIGDDVLLLEFQSPNNAIGFDIIQMIHQAIDEVEKNYKGLVIGNQGKNFCVGANIAMILMAAQEDDVFEVDLVVRKFQEAMLRIKYSERPVVVAPFGMTLGGGAEVSLPSAHIQASMETYIGLVETGVGLIPGGGGNKELYLKILRNLPEGVEVDLQAVANRVFETIALAKVSTSAEEARENNFLSQTDGISVNGDHLLYDAKQRVLALYDQGYQPPKPEKIPVTGETGYAALLVGAEAMRLSGYISEHDMKIAKKLAYVIAGGNVPYGTVVDEQYLLILEREAFISLVSEPKSQQRMQHMLMKGKPLRN